MDKLVRISELKEFIKVTTDSRSYNVSISADIFCDILRTARAAHEYKAENEKLREQLRLETELNAVSISTNQKLIEQLRVARTEERERCKKAVSEAGWLHLGDDAHSKNMDRTAIEQVMACVSAIEALGDAE